MSRKSPEPKKQAAPGAVGRLPVRAAPPAAPPQRPSSVVDTRVIYCGDNLEQLRRLPDGCVDLIYIDPPFNSNRNYEVLAADQSEPRAQASGLSGPVEDRHASTSAYIDYMRPRCVELARTLKKTRRPHVYEWSSPPSNTADWRNR